MSREISYGTAFFDGAVGNVIQSNSGVVASILWEAAGTFLITMDDEAALQPSDFVGYERDLVLATSALSWIGVVERVSSTQVRVRQATKAGLTDGVFGINISRVLRG